VNREYVVWAAAVIVLLLGGMLIGQQFMTLPSESNATAFRHWFWEARSLDLAVQVGLIFVGALGISALLPSVKEGDE